VPTPTSASSTCAQTQLGPAAAEDVEGGDVLGEADRGAKRQVRDVVRHPDRRRPRGHGRQQGRGAEVRRVVGVALHGEEVEPQHIGELGQLERLVHPGHLGTREHPELQLVP
jgi:hypothetical protein